MTSMIKLHLMARIGTSGKGRVVIGKLAKGLISGPLITVPNNHYYDAYTVQGDVTLDNKIVAANQTIIMDVGTDNIQGYAMR